MLPSELRDRLSRSPLAEPVVLVELFALSNIAFLAVDVGIAHAVNAFSHTAEWVPVGFSMIAPVVLVVGMALGGIHPALANRGSGQSQIARYLGMSIGWGAIILGIAGLLLHLRGDFFGQQTLTNLVYTAPFVAPLSYTGIGFLLLLNRMVAARSMEWARWVVLLALGGFVGNFVLTLADHAQNGFFHPSEWIGVVASAWGVSSLCAVLIYPRERTLIIMAVVMMIAQVGVGVLGAYLHLMADLRASAPRIADRFLYGAPLFAPLLFADLGMLALIALRGVAIARVRSVPEPSIHTEDLTAQ